MSSMAGWLGEMAGAERVLARMGEAMAGPRAVTGQLLGDGLAVVGVQTVAGEQTEQIAASDDGQVTVVFAGRLFIEDGTIRRFPARHCLERYLLDGTRLAVGLNGSFSVVIHDAGRSELHLVTDPLHSKPIYYRPGSPFLFASRITALLEAPGVDRRIDGDRVLEFLARRRVFGPVTYYDDIARAPDASVTTWDGSTVRSTRYWSPPADGELCHDIAENARALYQALAGAVARSSAGSERPALMLSGGLDSRVIAAASPRPLTAVTVHGHVGREVRVARRVANKLAWEHHFVQLPASFPLELVTDGSLVADGQDGFFHAEALYLNRWAEEQSVDGLLGGWFLETYFSGTDLMQRTLSLLGRRRDLPVLVPTEGVDVADWVWDSRAGMNAAALRELASVERLAHVVQDAKRRIRERADDLGGAPRDQQAFATLVLAGEMSAHPSRTNVAAADQLAPAMLLMCDRELIDLFFRIPREHRLYHRLYSHLLTRVDPRLRWIPYSGTGVPVSTHMWPEYIAGRAYDTISTGLEACARRLRPGMLRTSASWPHARRAMRYQEAWRTYLRSRASTSRLVDLGVLDGDALRRLVEDQVAGRRNYWVLLGLWITVEEWLERYG